VKRCKLFVLFAAIFALVVTTEGVVAQITIQLPGFKAPRYKKTYRPKKVRVPAAYADHSKWYATFRNGVDVALNDEGVIFSFDDRGEMILVVALRQPSGKNEGASVPIDFSFNDQDYGTFDGIQLEGRLIGLTGSAVFRLVDRFKRSKKFRIYVAGNSLSSHLRGSTRAIKKIERAARERRSYLRNNAGKVIEDARVKYLISRHKKRTQTLATNQQIASQKRSGIRNDNVNLNKSLRQENKPKIKVQYFVPGTKSIGEMWIDSDVVPSKGLVIKLNFVDPGHALDKVAHSTQLLPAQANAMASLLAKGEKWTEIAQKNKVGRFSKQLGFIAGSEDEKNRMAVNFKSYEDGSTAVQLEEVIAGYPKRFNFAIHNGLELATYLHDVVARAKQDFESKKMTKEQKDDLFN